MFFHFISKFRTLRSSCLSCVLLFWVSMPGYSSDHIDGPVTTAHRVGDIVDLYAFPTPNSPGKISIILDMYPLVARSGHFSDKVQYNIILRPAQIDQSSKSWKFKTGARNYIKCSVQTPSNTDDHIITCRTDNNIIAQTKFGKVREAGSGNGFDLFAGMRSDPFFFNKDFASKLGQQGIMTSEEDKNVMDAINCLSIAMNIDVNRVFPNLGTSLIAVAAESVTTDSSAANGYRPLDRIGRPEITNVTLVAHDGEEDLRDEYNAQFAFSSVHESKQKFKNRIFDNLNRYDKADGTIDWRLDQRDQLASLLVEDFLVVDFAKPCPDQAYLEIEKSMLNRKAYNTCGGRKPVDDIMDIIFSLYTTGLSGRRVRDGVDHPYKPLTTKFPYLAEPELSLSSRLKLFIATKFLGLSASDI